MNPVRFIVFDLDGTLVDSRRDLAESANAVLVECGGRPHSEDAIGHMVGDGAATLVRRAFEASGCVQPPHALARFLEIYNGRLLKFTCPYDGVPELLAALEGRLPLAVLTNKPLRPTEEILRGLSLARFFTRVVGGDGPFPRKPDPSGLHDLMATSGASARDTLLVGDSVIDWRTAHAAGARACLVRYGFGFHGFPIHEMTPEDLTVDRPGDLLALL